MTEPIAGTLSVSNEVIADIAGYAAMSCYGVVGMAEQMQGAESVRLLPGQRLRKGVLVTTTESGLTVDLHVVLEAGVNMRSVSDNLSSSVAFRDRPDRSCEPQDRHPHRRDEVPLLGAPRPPAFTRRKCQNR